jgi:hypothetical protein
VSGDAVTLARELVAHARWEHRRPDGQLRDGQSGIQWVPSDFDNWHAGGSGHPVPDLADGPTAGALLTRLGPALLAVHRGERETGPVWWVVFDGPDGRTHATLHCPTLGEAVARALLACWGPA